MEWKCLDQLLTVVREVSFLLLFPTSSFMSSYHFFGRVPDFVTLWSESEPLKPHTPFPRFFGIGPTLTVLFPQVQ